MFNQLPDDQTYSAHENAQLKFWTDIDLLHKLEDLVDQNSGGVSIDLLKEIGAIDSADDVFKFMDGPPFVSGELHIGHMLVSSIKSMVLNYQRQKGKKLI